MYTVRQGLQKYQDIKARSGKKSGSIEFTVQ
jgi:hypothetical protein